VAPKPRVVNPRNHLQETCSCQKKSTTFNASFLLLESHRGAEPGKRLRPVHGNTQLDVSIQFPTAGSASGHPLPITWPADSARSQAAQDLRRQDLSRQKAIKTATACGPEDRGTDSWPQDVRCSFQPQRPLHLACRTVLPRSGPLRLRGEGEEAKKSIEIVRSWSAPINVIGTASTCRCLGMDRARGCAHELPYGRPHRKGTQRNSPSATAPGAVANRIRSMTGAPSPPI